MHPFIVSTILALFVASSPVAYKAVVSDNAPRSVPPVSTTVPNPVPGPGDQAKGNLGEVTTPGSEGQERVELPKPPEFECPYEGQASTQQYSGSYPGTIEAQYHWRDNDGNERWCDLPTTGAQSIGAQIDEAWQDMGFCQELAHYFVEQAHRTNRWNGCTAPPSGTLRASSPEQNVLVLDYAVPTVRFNFDADVLGEGAAVAATTDVTVSMRFRFDDWVDGTDDDGRPATLEWASIGFARTNFDFQDGWTNFWVGGELDGPQQEMDRTVVDVTSRLAGEAAFINAELHFGARTLGALVPSWPLQPADQFDLRVSIDGPGLLVRFERGI